MIFKLWGTSLIVAFVVSTIFSCFHNPTKPSIADIPFVVSSFWVVLNVFIVGMGIAGWGIYMIWSTP